MHTHKSYWIDPVALVNVLSDDFDVRDASFFATILEPSLPPSTTAINHSSLLIKTVESMDSHTRKLGVLTTTASISSTAAVTVFIHGTHLLSIHAHELLSLLNDSLTSPKWYVKGARPMC